MKKATLMAAALAALIPLAACSSDSEDSTPSSASQEATSEQASSAEAAPRSTCPRSSVEVESVTVKSPNGQPESVEWTLSGEVPHDDVQTLTATSGDAVMGVRFALNGSPTAFWQDAAHPDMEYLVNEVTEDGTLVSVDLPPEIVSKFSDAPTGDLTVGSDC